VKICKAVVVALLLCAPVTPAAEPEWRGAAEGHSWDWPRDHWAHPEYRNEWWYFTGHLESVDDPGRRFGYQFTFFRVGLFPAKPRWNSDWASEGLIMGHAAISDLAAGEHRFSELLYRQTPFLGGFNVHPENPVAWSRAPAGTDDTWILEWSGEGYTLHMRDDPVGIALDLRTRPIRELVLQGEGGVSAKDDAPGVASLYYSFTRLETTGTVTLDGESWVVRGRSWMDKEFGSNQLGEGQVGWDWFSLGLDDGRDLMLYLLRREDGTVDFASGTIVGPGGEVRYLTSEDFTVRSTDTWTSPVTDAEYPSRWSIEVVSENLAIEVEPEMLDQENVSHLTGGLFYWEGAVRVSGESGGEAGRGYVELTGYGEGTRLPI
jgi:predicted secreted hydrolase